MDKLDLIVDKIDNVKEDVRHSNEELKQDITEIKNSLIEMEIDLRKNTDDMRYHIKRTDLIDSVLELLRQEVSVIKNKLTIEYLLKLVVTVSVGLGSISGAVYGILKLINLYNN